MNDHDKKLVLKVAERLTASGAHNPYIAMATRVNSSPAFGHKDLDWRLLFERVAQNVVSFSDSTRTAFEEIFKDELTDKPAPVEGQCAWCGSDLSDKDPKLFIQSPETPADTCCNAKCYHSYLGDQSQCTTDGKPPIDPNLPGAPGPIEPSGQHSQYWVLCDDERQKGFVRPVRRTYVHVGVGGHEHRLVRPGCGVATTMGLALCETYARDPGYYGSTYCCGCGAHFPVAEFKWGDGNVVGT
jgi:hypothetical protein